MYRKFSTFPNFSVHFFSDCKNAYTRLQKCIHSIAKMHTLDCKNAYRTILNTSTPVGVGTRLNVPTSCGP